MNMEHVIDWSSLLALPKLCLCLLLITPNITWALGTPAGTVISNTVTLNYMTGTVAAASVTGNSVPFLVDRKINLVVVEVSGSATSVNNGQTGAVTTFSVTNLGNDTQGFTLNTALATVNPAGAIPFSINNFSATGAIAYVDANNNGVYEPLIDTILFISSLAADATQKVFIVADIPVATLIGQQSVVSLMATAVTPNTLAPLVETLGKDTAGIDMLFADSAGVTTGDIARDAKHSAFAGYLVGGVNLSFIKSIVSVLDTKGTAVLMPGAVMTYQIMATLSGIGSATNLVITDPMPINTTYVPGSIIVNGVAKTDAADVDNSQFIGVTQTVSVSLGNVAAPANTVITFRATIN